MYAQKQAAGDYAVAEIVKDISPNACQHVHLIDAFDFEQSDRKQIIFTEGAKGGGGKTTLLSSLADFFRQRVFRSNWSMQTLTIKAEEA